VFGNIYVITTWYGQIFALRKTKIIETTL